MPISTKAKCSIRTLKNVCNICEERALEKLSIDSACPVCPEVNCPAQSHACIQQNSFEPFLKQNYTLIAMIWQDQDDVLFKLNITKNTLDPRVFNYEVRYRNMHPVIRNSRGFLTYDIVNFNLPMEIGERFYSFNCNGGIDLNSTLNGSCSTIAPDNKGTPTLYSFEFVALPTRTGIQ